MQFKADRLEFHMAPIKSGGATMCSLGTASWRGNKKALITADAQGHICGWDLLTKDLLLSSRFHDYPVISLEGHLGNNIIMSADSGLAADAGNGASIVLLSALTGKALVSISRESEYDPEEYSSKTGAISKVVALRPDLLVQACGCVLFVHKKRVLANPPSFALLHVLQAHEYPISQLIAIKGISGEQCDGSEAMQEHFAQEYVVSAGMDPVARVWEVISGNLRFELPVDAPVNCLSSSENGRVAIGTLSGTVFVFDGRGVKLGQAQQGSNGPITALQISRDGSFIMAGYRDGSIHAFGCDSQGLKHLYELTESKASNNTCLCLTFDHRRLAAGFQNGDFILYYAQDHHDLKNGCVVLKSFDRHLSAITNVKMDDESEYLCATSQDCSVSVLDFRPLNAWTPPRDEEESMVQESNSGEIQLAQYDARRQTYMGGPPTLTWNSLRLSKETKDPMSVVHIHDLLIEKPVNKEVDRYKRAMLVSEYMSEEECRHYLDECEKLGFECCQGYNPKYRSNTRVIIEDPYLAQAMFERGKHLVPQTYEHEGDTWDVIGLNPTLRFCKYIPGQHFSPHYDGFFERDCNERSFFTFMVYMNDSAPDAEGATVFLHSPHQRHLILGKVQPKRGQLIVFENDLYHEGEVLKSGVKYLLRTDLMYRRRQKSV